MGRLRKRKIRAFGLGLMLVGLLVPSMAGAVEARLTDIVLTNTREHVVVYFRVIDCFTEEMEEAIHNGINTAFTFFIRLEEVRSLWWDQELVDIRISHEIKYDSLKKVYRVRLSEKQDGEVTVGSFAEAKKLMSEVAALQIIDLEDLQRDRRYKVSMMAELDTIKLPFYLHYVFFFLSLWDFETDWYTVDFTYY